MDLEHHDLCFGCGPVNPFGLQLELERRDDGSVEGRFFVKQDHQGPPGLAHGGILAAALDDAMSLAAGDATRVAVTAELSVELLAPAPVGAFVRVRAVVDRAEGRRCWASATALPAEGEAPLARGTGVLVRFERAA